MDGLSALAVTDPPSQAIALRDEEPAQLFTLSLGDPRKLTPSVTGVQGLYGPDGGTFPKFDGEGLVVEKGGHTALVSAEKGPAIRRFDIRSGKQLGEDLKLPESFTAPPGGRAEATRSLESLTVTPDGKHLFTGMEGALIGDEDVHGRHQVRIQRFTGKPRGGYTADLQYAYQTEEGLYLSELVSLDKNHLLALERGYISQLGNGIHVYRVDAGDAPDVTNTEFLDDSSGDALVRKEPLFNLADCPPGNVKANEPQSNQLLQNVEGMAVAPLPGAQKPDHRLLYLIADNNSRRQQTSRVYTLDVKVG